MIYEITVSGNKFWRINPRRMKEFVIDAIFRIMEGQNLKDEKLAWLWLKRLQLGVKPGESLLMRAGPEQYVKVEMVK